MAKELEANDNTAQDQERQQRHSGDKREQQINQGKALQMNDNSAGGKEPARSPAPPRRGSGNEPNQAKLSR